MKRERTSNVILRPLHGLIRIDLVFRAWGMLLWGTMCNLTLKLFLLIKRPAKVGEALPECSWKSTQALGSHQHPLVSIRRLAFPERLHFLALPEA